MFDHHADLHSQDVAMMRLAINLAREASAIGEIPVGALVVREGQILSKAHNLRETLQDPTAHAERLALTQAGSELGTWRLEDCTLYVTLEPCMMCAGAITLSRIRRLVFGALDPKAGACRSLYRLVDDPRMNHRTCQISRVLAEECSSLLTDFFAKHRSSPSKVPRRGA